MLPSLEESWELYLRTSSISLLEDPYVEFTTIAMSLERGKKIFMYS